MEKLQYIYFQKNERVKSGMLSSNAFCRCIWCTNKAMCNCCFSLFIRCLYMIYAQSIVLERLLSFTFSVTAAWLLPAKLLLYDFYQGSAAECLSLYRPQLGHSFPTYYSTVFIPFPFPFCFHYFHTNCWCTLVLYCHPNWRNNNARAYCFVWFLTLTFFLCAQTPIWP